MEKDKNRDVLIKDLIKKHVDKTMDSWWGTLLGKAKEETSKDLNK